MVAGRGLFITLEGGEGAGKSTQLRLLAAALEQAGHVVCQTREPGGSPGADILRELLLSGRHEFAKPAEVLLHFASRAEHVARVVEPALASGAFVVCDRYYDSTMVYQGYGLGAEKGMIRALSGMIGLVPDLTIMLDVSVETTLRRMALRGGAQDRYERLGAAFFERIREGFLEVAAEAPARCVVLSGEAAEEEVAAGIWRIVSERLSP